MAIPFMMPSDEEVEAQLFADLYDILQQIQRLRRARANQSQQSTRVRSTPSVCRQSREEPIGVLDRLTDIDNSSTLPSPAGNSQSQLDILHQQTVLQPNLHCRHPCCESTICDESKTNTSTEVDTTTQDWTQVGVTLRKIADEFGPGTRTHNLKEPSQSSSKGGTSSESCGSESLLSKLVPAPFSGSIWTAVICVVGWHLLRTR